MKEGRYLGIDPGLANVGLAVYEVGEAASEVINHSRLIITFPEWKMRTRLGEIAECLWGYISEWLPFAGVGVEKITPHGTKRRKHWEELLQAYGVIKGVLIEAGLEWEEFTPQQLKRTIGLASDAKKIEVRRTVRTFFGLPKLLSEHESDAVAVAIAAAKYQAKKAIGDVKDESSKGANARHGERYNPRISKSPIGRGI